MMIISFLNLFFYAVFLFIGYEFSDESFILKIYLSLRVIY